MPHGCCAEPTKATDKARLDPLETPRRPHHHVPSNPDQPPVDASGKSGFDRSTLAEVWLHTGWAAQRARVYAALKAAPATQTTLDNFRHCGYYVRVFRTNDTPPRYKLGGSGCHSRWCTPCSNARSQTIARNVLEHVGKGPTRFLTLTLAHDFDGLEPALNHLYASFRRLQRQPIWQARVTGGVAFLELTCNDFTERWHPHLHCLVQGKYLPKQELTEAWTRVTDGSYILKINLVKGAANVSQYVTKYASKPMQGTWQRKHNRLTEAIRVLAGRRMLHTFGTWRKHNLTNPEDHSDWEDLGSLNDWIDAAGNGDAQAAALLSQLNHELAQLVLRLHGGPARASPLAHPPTQGKLFDLYRRFH